MKRRLLALTALACLSLSLRVSYSDPGGLIIIANPQVPATAISRQTLAAIYLLRTTAWSDRKPIVPVNQRADSATRERFSMFIFGERPVALTAYWNRLHFEGYNPPLVLESDQDVVIFVKKVPGAIGYVQEGTPVNGTKILSRLP